MAVPADPGPQNDGSGPGVAAAAGDRRRSHPRSATGVLVLFVAAVAVAELVTVDWLGPLSTGDAVAMARAGLVAHTVLVAAGLLAGAHYVRRGWSPFGKLLMAASLGPLLRVLSLAAPLETTDAVDFALRLFVIGVPLSLGLLFVVRLHGLSLADVGVRWPERRAYPWLVELSIVVVSVPFGFIEFLILRPSAVGAGASVAALVLAGLAILLTTAFLEEVLFRGLLQRHVLRAYRPQLGILLVSLLFAALHIATQEPLDLVFVFVVGWTYAQIVLATGTILGVTLSHGMTNVVLFLVAPRVL